MDFHEIKGDGYIPIYTRNEVTDALHDAFALKTDTEIVTHKTMNKMIRFTRKGN